MLHLAYATTTPQGSICEDCRGYKKLTASLGVLSPEYKSAGRTRLVYLSSLHQLENLDLLVAALGAGRTQRDGSAMPGRFSARSLTAALARIVVPNCLFMPSSREATFTVSPIAVYCRRSSAPTLPTTATPVWSPKRVTSSGRPAADVFGVERVDRGLQLQRAAAAVGDMVGVLGRRVPHRVDGIAEILHDDAVVALHDDIHGLEIGGQHVDDGLRRMPARRWW